MTWTALLLLAQAANPNPPQHPPAHPGHAPAHYAQTLEDPRRDEWQKPHDVVMALALRPDEIVADLGAGTGYFTRRLARHAGRVLAVDIEPKLLSILRENAPANVEAVLAMPADPRLAPESVDTILICNVLHHISERGAYLPRLKRALRPDGRIVVIEFLAKPLPIGPGDDYKISETQMDTEMKAIGMRRAKVLSTLPYQYFFEYR
jgi:ubiquinone/menaquinone biosynthesis C-methylase UbiE